MSTQKNLDEKSRSELSRARREASVSKKFDRSGGNGNVAPESAFVVSTQ
jgi:hypothetical protein